MQAESILQHHSSVYSIVTEQILKQLESGVAPWRKPWRAEPPRNLVSGKEYRGINTFLLASQGYGSRYWLTFNQAGKLGGHIRKGEKSSIVTFWNIGEEKIVQDADGNTHKSKPFLLRYYRVFNVEQTEGIADKLGLGNASPRVASIEKCEAIVNGMPNAPAIQQDARAWYRPSTDTVGMPSKSLFNSSEEYYSTLFHELTHNTGHSSRVRREGIEDIAAFGSESYSKEELIAEMGAAMLCGITGISPATIPNSAAYLQGWIKRLRGDSKLLVSAASQAQKGCRLYPRGCAMSTPSFPFPVSLSEKYRPRAIAEFVGLDKPRKILTKFANSPYPSAWLFVGPPGVGKTSMALALANQIKAELHHVPSQKCNAEAIEKACHDCWFVPLAGGFHIVLVDEADKMTPSAQLALLSKLDATAFPPNTIFIFTCNETGNLEPRFLSRCRVIEFSSYGMATDIAEYLEKVWHAEGGNGNGPELARLAKESRNNVRDCLMRLEIELMAL